MEFSLEQRLFNLRISRKDLERECSSRNRKVSYETVRKVINEPYYMTGREVREKVLETLTELEQERGIKSILFD